jgi:hypothetical protein
MSCVSQSNSTLQLEFMTCITFIYRLDCEIPVSKDVNMNVYIKYMHEFGITDLTKLIRNYATQTI